MKLSELYEGWRNNLFPPEKLKKVIETVGKKRMAICSICEHNSKFHNVLRFDEHCVICLCTLSAKTKCLSCSCPLKPPKWKAIITEEQEEQMLPEDEEKESSS